MSSPASEPAVERPLANQDVAPQTRVGRFSIPTQALRAYTMLFALVAVWAIFTYTTDGIFLESRNLSNLMRQTAVTGVLAVGMLMVIVTGQIDLSVGSIVGLAGGVAAIVLSWLGWGLVPSLMAGVLVGVLIGAAQGALVAYGNIPAFIVTLGGLLAWRGAIKGISKGSTVPVNSETFIAIGQFYVPAAVGYALAAVAIVAICWLGITRFLAQRRDDLRDSLIVTGGAASLQTDAANTNDSQTQAASSVQAVSPARSASPAHAGVLTTGALQTALRILLPSALVIAFILKMNSYAGIPIPVIILLVIALLGAFLTNHTTFGRYLYAIGGNPDAARLSGINLRRHILAVFCIMGALAGAASIIYTARVGSASPDAGVLLELDAIAACVIGGASLMGGRGAVWGACLGALFMASLDNGMSLENISDFTQDIVKGVILVTAVGLDMLGRRRG